MREEVDGKQMRWIEAKAREIGHVVGAALNRAGKRYGFALFVFSFDGPEMTWLSNAQRPEMLKALKEFIERQEKGEAAQTWEQRN